MPTSEKLKCQLLKLDADGDGWKDRVNTICPLDHSSNGRGIKSSLS